MFDTSCLNIHTEWPFFLAHLTHNAKSGNVISYCLSLYVLCLSISQKPLD